VSISSKARDEPIARQRQAQPAADGGAVDRRDHRLVQAPQRQDDVIEQLHRAQSVGRLRQAVDVRNLTC
jgi:hypothetical protein